MNLILFDCHETRENLLPLTFTRTVGDIRIGILTIREKWERLLEESSYSLSEPYLQGKFPTAPLGSPALYVNGAVLPNDELITAIEKLGALQKLCIGDELIAFKSEKHHLNYENFEAITHGFAVIQYAGKHQSIAHPWDIFKMNAEGLKSDFQLITEWRKSQPLSDSNKLIGSPTDIFLEEGAVVEACILNTLNGPIYIGKSAEMMEGSVIRGPFSLGEHSTLKMAAKVYGATTIGPHCKVGGEVSNSVLFGYTNKAHDGFLGNSVIGEWCNLGADTNNSNLKNNYGDVELYNYREGKMSETGLMFCGLIMGDHSKSGINTMFNTGTVVGVSSNIFGGDFQPKFIPSFSWGGNRFLRTFTFDKALEAAGRMMERRGLSVTEADIKILQTVFDREAKNRKS